MLTKDLLRFHILSGYAKPSFVKTSDPKFLRFAEELLQTFRNFLDSPRTELEDAVMPSVNMWTDLKLSRGILKTLDDACIYSGVQTADFPELRRRLFTESSKRLSGNDFPQDHGVFRDVVFSSFDESMNPLQEDIYADLPDYERLIEVPEWSAEELLNRYNCSLAQSLVIYADSMELTVYEPDPARMRRFFKYMKFYRLLATVKQSSGWTDGVPGVLKLNIDGPASILENGAAYGLRMASFMPAAFQLPQWKICCQLKLKNRDLKLVLDEKSGLSRRFGNFSCYIPEEYAMFEKLFAEKSAEWKISDAGPFIRRKGSQEFIFPDMTFTNGTQTVSLELFHKWHAAKLQERLQFLHENPQVPLIIGADRSLFLKREGEPVAITENPLYGTRLFLFRDFPGVANVLKLLANFDPQLFS